jgi:hypothetical protein
VAGRGASLRRQDGELPAPRVPSAHCPGEVDDECQRSGFTATGNGGQIPIDPTELEDAARFPKCALPPLPSEMSIARRLIDSSAGARSQSPSRAPRNKR